MYRQLVLWRYITYSMSLTHIAIRWQRHLSQLITRSQWNNMTNGAILIIVHTQYVAIVKYIVCHSYPLHLLYVYCKVLFKIFAWFNKRIFLNVWVRNDMTSRYSTRNTSRIRWKVGDGVCDLTLGSLCLPCCVPDTEWNWFFILLR